MVRPKSIPRWVGANAERALIARGDEKRLKRVFDRSSLPMILADSERRYVEANTAARLFARLTLAEVRQLRIDDLTPPERLDGLNEAWERLMSVGCVAGTYELTLPDGSRLDTTYFALAEALTERHLIAFAPAGWQADELLHDEDRVAYEGPALLTPREMEVLELAGEGRRNPMIAEELWLSVATVRTHLENIYAKLGVHDRASAVAKALRQGLIS